MKEKDIISATHAISFVFEMPKLAIARLNLEAICTSNSMGNSEIWDKYQECCIENFTMRITEIAITTFHCYQ